MTKQPWVVHKFGGTSVANAERYRAVAEILRGDKSSRKAVVVSAMSGVTDALLDLVDVARKQDDAYLLKLEAMRKRHQEAIDGLLPGKARLEVTKALETDIGHLKDILRGLWLAKSAPESSRELVSGYGEVWSARLLDAYLRATGVESTFLDARNVLVVTPAAHAVSVEWERSQTAMNQWLSTNLTPSLVITGFVASTPDGVATTLKRNGSDFSASIFGALLDASIITIWTDVDGVLTADPRLVSEAVVIDEMSYAEATELAYFGAKVVHPSTMAPAIRRGIPLWIRNTFKPAIPGTKIHGDARSALPVKGFANVPRMALVNVEGTGMIGVPGVAQRLFGALSEVGVSVVMISQASSEHSICFAIPESQVDEAKAAVEKAFFAELHHGQIQTVSIVEGCSTLAIVGDNMVNHPGTAGRFFTALGRAGINVRAIAQGSSERNISAVIDESQATRALRAAHAAFYLSPQTLSLGLIGCGNIGATLLSQLHAAVERLKSDHQIDLRVRAVMSTSRMILADGALDLAAWKDALARGESADVEKCVAHVQADHIPHSAIIDCTASDTIAKHYPAWLGQGIHVITPNKKAGTSPLPFYRELRAASRRANAHFMYETTVGGGLPLLRTLRDLVRTGDRILRIEGILSGTLSFLFNGLKEKQPFSERVKEALDLGLTEPDAREDLSGRDVARKLVILAREMGRDIELDDVKIESLVPEPLRRLPAGEWLPRLADHDKSIAGMITAAASQGEVLRYVGVVDENGKASASLKPYPATHPFARMTATDNMVAFTTARYRAQPLIVQGPGAGPEVTAGGVFADILRLASYLGATP